MAEDGTSPVAEHPSRLTGVVERNIEALMARRQAQEQARAAQDRLADSISRFTGSMTFVYLHLVFFGAWVTINLGLVGILPFDPTFVILAMFASVEAIFLSTFVLITQNRMAKLADRRADLDLQISLLTEHEITRLIRLVSAIAAKMDVHEAKSSEIEELRQDVAPEKVMDRIEQEESVHGYT